MQASHDGHTELVEMLVENENIEINYQAKVFWNSLVLSLEKLIVVLIHTEKLVCSDQCLQNE